MSKTKEFDFRVNNFNLIRLLAAIQVVLIHAIEHLKIPSDSNVIGALATLPGVPIFFVISGFLIAASYQRAGDVNSYFKNRFLRIYPGLWACFFVSLITVFIFFKPEADWRSWAAWIAAQLSIGQFYNPDFLRNYGVGTLNGSLWTIPVELQFYAVLPALYLLFNRVKWNKYVLGIIFTGLIAINQSYISQQHSSSIAIKLFGVTVLPYLYMFLLGVFLQRQMDWVKRFLVGKAAYWWAGFVVLTLVLHYMGLNVRGNALNPVSAIFLGFLVISTAYTRPGITPPLIEHNDLSYGVYIYHMIVINALVHLNYRGHFAYLVLTFITTLILAWLSWKFVEKPALRLKNYSIFRGPNVAW